MTGEIENRTFDELEVGDAARLERVLTAEDIELFAFMSGDVNPAHLDPDYAQETPFKKVIAHGMWGAALISAALGAELPGPGTIYVRQELKFVRPVFLGARVGVQVVVREKIAATRRVLLDCVCLADGKPAIVGEAEVIAPDRKIRRPRAALHPVFVHERGSRLRALADLATRRPPVPMAVLEGGDFAQAIAAAGVARPVAIDGLASLRAAAEAGEIGLCLAPANSLDAVLSALDGGDFASHAALVDAPASVKTLIVTDAMVNAAPTYAQKRAIAANAVRLAQAIGVAAPRVAALASERAVAAGARAAEDAARLREEALTGARVDGPVTLSRALREGADILLAPDIEAADLLVENLDHLAGAVAAYVIVGARAPIALFRPDDPPEAVLAAAAAARLLGP